MAGDGLKAPRAAAAGERHIQPRGGALRGGDAGHDFERDSGRLERGDLFFEAPEHQRVAGFEPDHAPAGIGERDHQVVDVTLLAGAAVALLADVDALGA